MKFRPGLTLLIPLLIALVATAPSFGQTRKLTSYVDTFIGTDGFGHTFPGASLPFGMVQLSPDTRISGWENCSGYHASNPTIIGFSHTHLSGTGAADYGDILFMATQGTQTMAGDETRPYTGYRSAFQKESERAVPGYYRVMLADYGIQAEMTATTRCGMHKYTFPKSDSSVIILDLVHGIGDAVKDASVEITGDRVVSGYRRSSGWAKDHTVYFYAEFSKAFAESGIATARDIRISEKKKQAETGLKAWFRFDLRNYEPVMVKVGLSTVSVENARTNLETEIYDWDFTRVMFAAKDAWESELSRIVVEGGTKAERVNFYTALYHAMLAPNIMSDTDGRYMGMDGRVHRMERGNMYTVFSLWDTFRALHPLFTLIDPARAQEFVRALLIKYKEWGMLPVWELASNETNCMIGNHAIPVIADTYMKGLVDFDAELALEAMKKSANSDVFGLKHYKSHGYIPSEFENEPVSRTLEYAYNDWCIAVMAGKMGRAGEMHHYMRRAQNYKNVYDTLSGFMRGKKNGNWIEPFDPSEVSGMYTEANAWQYTWFVPHDIPGMIERMGGKSKFRKRLDELFTTSQALSGRSQPDISGMIGQYAHGNEPSHHMAYLYNWTDTPNRTAELTRKIMNEFYTNERDGLIGNEDCGQMSAWYVFSAMGFYPVCPGDNQYAWGSPLFKKITIGNLSAGKITIECDSISDVNRYVTERFLNDRPLQGLLNHSDLMNGGTLKLIAKSDHTGMESVTGKPLAPELVTTPFLRSGQRAFTDSCYISMHSYTTDAIIRYTMDGSEPDSSSTLYTAPFYLHQSARLAMKSFKDGLEPGFTERVSFIKIPFPMKVTYTHPYSHLYTAGGDNGLVDGEHGEPGVFGGWQGFHATDADLVIDLSHERSITEIGSSFMQQFASWIWLPSEISYSVSNDSINFTEVYRLTHDVPLDEPGSFVKSFHASFPPTTARYIRVQAKNIARCPDWHPGAGDKAWIFMDEVVVK